MKKCAIFLIGITLLLGNPAAKACSSCGSGGEDPLILFPNENRKIYLGLTSENGFRDITYDGEQRTAQGILQKQTLLLAYGQRLTPKLVSVLSVPYVSNSHQDESYQAFGDGQISFRYDIYQQSFARPWLPQLQVLAARKHANTRSIESSREPYFVDAVGSGYHENRVGLDVFSGMTPVIFGASYTVTFFEPKVTERGRQSKAPLFLGNLTVGYSDAKYKCITGLVMERQGARASAGQEVARSDHLKYSAFLTGESQVTEWDRLRFTLVKKALPSFSNKQTARSTSVSLAYMRALK